MARNIDLGYLGIVSEERARELGCLPEQRRARLAKLASLMEARGFGNTHVAKVARSASTAPIGSFAGEVRRG